MLALFIFGAFVEVLLHFSVFWKLRVWMSGLAIVVISFSSTRLLIDNLSIQSIFMAVISIFRLINLLRIAEGRSNENYLKRTSWKTTRWLIGAQLVFGILLMLDNKYPDAFTTHYGLVALGLLQCAAAIVILRTTLRSINKMRFQPLEKFLSDKELPTVTVAIPARNETTGLTDCLEAILASNYPKLEILVLDDCSQDATNEVIKSFARDGVRFLHGSEPKDNWLAKNQAYDQLSDEATGQYIIFAGVDTKFGPDTVRSLVLMAINREKQMISVLPRHQDQGIKGSLVQPMRYWWELAIPRRFFNRPAVLSTCWLIKKSAIKDLGGFEAVSRSILPEAFFARQLTKTDGYSFVRNSAELELKTLKNFDDQISRAVRMRYPSTHRRIELVALLAAAEILLLLGPFLLLPYAVVTGSAALAIPAFIAAIGLLISHNLILGMSCRLRPLIAIINFPIIVVVEVALGLMSMLKYEFSVVEWKGRNICLPVMHRHGYRPSS